MGVFFYICTWITASGEKEKLEHLLLKLKLTTSRKMRTIKLR